MKEEDKKLLLIDLSARLPYRVKLNCCSTHGVVLQSIDSNGLINNDYDIDEVKPYLFPLEIVIDNFRDEWVCLRTYISLNHNKDYMLFDWLNRNHVDYRGLLEKGLAINANNEDLNSFKVREFLDKFKRIIEE